MGPKELVVTPAASFDSVARCERPRDSRCSARLRAWRTRAWARVGVVAAGVEWDVECG